MPWILDRMMDFLGEENIVEKNVDGVVVDGYDLGSLQHRQSVIREYQRRHDVL